MSVLIKMIATNPPALMIVGGFLLLIMGASSDNGELVRTGNWIILGGFTLQILWLILRRK